MMTEGDAGQLAALQAGVGLACGGFSSGERVLWALPMQLDVVDALVWLHNGICLDLVTRFARMQM
jgi:hypothetical protein